MEDFHTLGCCIKCQTIFFIFARLLLLELLAVIFDHQLSFLSVGLFV